MLNILLTVIPTLCMWLMWCITQKELKEVKRHRDAISEQNDALWEIVKHLAGLRLNIEPEEKEE